MTWLKKLGFLCLWTLAHGVSGALGLVLAEAAVRAKPLGSYSGIVGVILFEGAILFFKEIVARRFRDRIEAYSLDRLAWILGGFLVILSRWLGEGAFDEEFTPISFDIIRWSTLFGMGIALIAHLPRLVNWLKPKISHWHNQSKDYFLDRPFLGIFKYPYYVLAGLFLFLLLYVLLAVYFVALFFLSLVPIEFFKEEFQDLLWPMKTIWFGFSSVGFAGFLTGMFYLMLPRFDKPLIDMLLSAKVTKG